MGKDERQGKCTIFQANVSKDLLIEFNLAGFRTIDALLDHEIEYLYADIS